jgi:hypothetical protein
MKHCTRLQNAWGQLTGEVVLCQATAHQMGYQALLRGDAAFLSREEFLGTFGGKGAFLSHLQPRHLSLVEVGQALRENAGC